MSVWRGPVKFSVHYVFAIIIVGGQICAKLQGGESNRQNWVSENARVS